MFRKASLSTKILIALCLGVLVGLFFGERVAFLQVLGDAFIKLLLMTVLPYVTVSLITGLGGLDYRQAGALAKQGGLVLLMLWAVGLILVVLMPLCFPDWKAATFFNSSLIEQRAPVDFLGLYIPANPFHSLANNIVPAVVLFSAALGIALISVPNKEPLLTNLGLLTQGLTRITTFVVGLTPIGVFGIGASAAGTLRVDDLERLQVFLVSYILLALILAFWILPGLVTAFTPLTYRDVVGTTKDVLITAFATGSVFVVLPLLAERSKLLLKKLEPEGKKTDSLADVVVPTSYSFPSVGTVLMLSFVLFAGWYTGAPVSVTQYPVFAVSGVLSVFGGVYVAVPFLLDLLRIPSEAFQLLVIFNPVIGSRFGSLLASLHILVLTLLSASLVIQRATLRPARLVRFLVITVAMIAAALIGVGLFFTYVVEHEYKSYKTFVQMELQGTAAESTVDREPPAPLPLRDPEKPTLDRIRENGMMRVGYMRDLLPYAFFNEDAHLVGLDVEMAHLLARELGVTLEFVQIERDRLTECLDSGYCDIIMSGLAVTTERAEEMAFTASYMDQTLAFIVEDHRRNEFNSRAAVLEAENLRIGVLDIPYIIAMLEAYLPSAEVVRIDSARDFFRGNTENLDALAYSAQAGSSWSMVYPGYTVALPHPDVVAVPGAYAVKSGESQMLEFMNTWIALKKKDGSIDRLYAYWIEGMDAVRQEPRWSIVHDVLGWMD